MPSYDLACEGCGTEFEVFRTRFLRDEDRECPACGAAGARQLMRAGFVSGVAPAPQAAAGGAGGCCGGSCGCGG